MRMKGKKPIFNRKDTWSLNDVLSPIIAEGLKKFLEVKRSEKGEWFGVPGGAIEEYQKRNELPIDGWHADNETLKEADKVWEEILEKMIYAFENKEPNPDDYGYNIEFKDDKMVITGNVLERKRYAKDVTIHENKVKEGHELFGKFYNNLWW